MNGKERTTPQKKAVISTFEVSKRPLTADEVHRIASDTCPGLGLATVYRALNRLVESAWLKEVRLPDHPIRYEKNDLEHHHHFHCDTCERVLDIAAPCESLSALIPKGFSVRKHDLTFYGTCADCE